MMIVYQGNNYQIRVGDLLSVAGVPTSTQVIAGTGMTGGGQLTGNVTLSVAPKGVNGTLLSDTGVASGVYGDATNIPVFTVDSTGRVTAATSVPATISGYVPTSTQVIAGNGLTGGGLLSSNVTLAASYSASAPEAGFQTGSAGVANTLARSDHKHPAVDLSADDQVDNILGLGNGGTARSLVMQPGAVIWSGADGLYVGPAGFAGQVLVSGGSGAPTWGSALLVVDQPANVVYAGPAAGPDAPTTFRALVNADLPASGVTANTYGSSTAIPVVTVNSKGVITSITTSSFTGGLSYQGSWNASTNTPTLTSSVGTNGYYYIVSVAGSTNLNGITDWQVGDWAIFNGTVWQKIDQTNLVSSVNGQTGVVSIAYADLAGAIPTWAIANGGTGQTTASAAFNALSPITTTGDLILGNGTNSATRLAIGANGYLLSSNGTTASWQPAPAGGVTTFDAGTTGLTPASATTGAISLAGTLVVSNGGTGATTLTGYVKGTGTSALTASSTIPNTDITGLGTMSTQNANSVAVTGGSINGTTVGATTASTGAFTSVTGTVDATFNGVTVGKGASSISNNTVVGLAALDHITTGQQNTAMGSNALTVATTANNQTAIGYLALRASNGADNTAVGSTALQNTSSGSGNVAMGFQALTANTTGSSNTAIGRHALITNSTGSNITALGNHAGAYETGSNALYIDAIDRTNTAGDKAGALLYGTFNATPSSQTLAINAAVTLPYTLGVTGAVTLSGGTANGVTYLNGSKEVTSGSALTFNGTNLSTTGQVISTKTGTATDATGQVYLNGSTSNRVEWNTQGTGAPAFTTRSAGTKLLLYPTLSGSVADYAIGIDAATMWYSIPENNASFKFKWYGATTEIASLDGAGAFTAVGGISGGTF
jgi:hypothetical protein